MTLHSEVAIKAQHLFSTEVGLLRGVLGKVWQVVLVKQTNSIQGLDVEEMIQGLDQHGNHGWFHHDASTTISFPTM